MLLGGCARRDIAVQPAPPTSDLVVVMVPGTTGTALIEADTQQVLWGDGRSLLRPRERGYALALPLAGEPDGPRVVAGAALDRLSLGPLTMQVYGPWKSWMADHGYPVGDPREPRPDDRFFVFGYDWRRSNVTAAQELGGWLEALAARRGGRLRVALIAQSNGGLITRYLTKYGTASLDDAAAGRRQPPTGVTIVGYALVGTANGGSLRVLEEMNQGRRNVPLVGRRWPPEVLFTFPALYEALPIYRRDVYVDDEMRPMDVDLFDADVWPRFGWSLFTDDARRRIERHATNSGTTLFGSPEERTAFLTQQLTAALRVHDVLLRDPPGWQPVSWLSMQHGDRATAERGQLRQRSDGFELRLERPGTTAPGDGHATRASQQYVSPAERDALAEPTLYAEGTHFSVVLADTVMERFVAFLRELDERTAPAAGAARSGVGTTDSATAG